MKTKNFNRPEPTVSVMYAGVNSTAEVTVKSFSPDVTTLSALHVLLNVVTESTSALKTIISEIYFIKADQLQIDGKSSPLCLHWHYQCTIAGRFLPCLRDMD